MVARFVYLVILFAFCVFVPSPLIGQSLTTKGKEFWLGFMENNNRIYSQYEWISIYISSRVNTNGTVRVPLAGFTQNFTVNAGQIQEVTLPANVVLNIGSDQIQNRGIQVVANDTVNVYGINYQVNTEDATVILPIHTLREDYYVTSYNEGPGSSEFLVVAVEDGTELEITPSAPINGGRPQGFPYNITLRKGETYQAQSEGDLTGTRITIKKGSPCKRFAVFGGNICANVGGCGRCDHLYEQMFPINTWGYTYVVAPLKTRIFDRVRILASENNTTVTAAGQTYNLNAGQFQDIDIRQAIYIQGSKPISVAQFSVGACCEQNVDCRDNNIYADPFMLLVSSVEQMTIKRSTFSSFNIQNISRNFINVIARTSYLNQVKRNGTTIPASEFRPVPGKPELSYAQLEVNKGVHTIEADSGIIAYVYGFGERDSYGYSGDVVLNNIALQIESKDVACVGERVVFKGKATRTITEWRWLFGDDREGMGQTANYTFTRPGTYTVKLIVKREGTNCILDSTEKQIVIRPAGETPELEPGTILQDQTICPGRPVERLNLNGHRGANIEWQVSTNKGVTWTPIPNNNNQTSYQPVNINSETWYRIRITDESCGEEFSQTPAKIFVAQGVTEGELEGGQTLCAESVSPTIKLEGYENATIVKWQTSLDGNSWTDVVNTTRTYSIANLNRTTYFRAVLNFGPCGLVNSETTAVVLTAPSLAGKLTGAGNICPGESKTLKLSDQRGTIRRWEFSLNGREWQTVPNSAGKTELQVANPNATQFFRVVVQNENCEPATTEAVEVKLLANATAGTLEGGKNLCALVGSSDLSLKNSSGTILRWESSENDGESWVSIAHTATTFKAENITKNTSFRVWVGTSCGEVFSNTVKISLTAPTIAGEITGAKTVCAGQTNINLNLTGQVGTIVTWESGSGGTNFRPVANSSGKTTLETGNLTTTTNFRVRIQSGECEPVTTEPVEVKVIPMPKAGALSGGRTFCAETGKVTLTLAPSVGEIEKWQASNDENRIWRDIDYKQNTYDTGDIPLTTSYRVIVKNECGRDTSNVMQVVVIRPSSGGTLVGDRTVCGGNNNIRLELANQVGNVVNWESSSDGVRWNVVSNTGTMLILTNLTQTTYYRVTVQNGSCPPVKSTVAKVTIEEATVVPGTLSADTAACSKALNTTLHLKGYTGLVIRWESTQDSAKTWKISNHSRDSLQVVDQSKTTWYRVMVRNGDCAEAYSNIVKVVNKPLSDAGVLSETQFVCQGTDGIPLKLTGYQGVIVSWETSPNGYDSWQPIANETTPTHAIGIPDVKTWYRVRVQNGDCDAAYSNSVFVDISLPTEPGNVTGGDSSCIFALPELTLENYRGRIVRWEKSTDGGNVWKKLTVYTPVYNPDTVRQTTLFRAIVKNGGCPEAASTPTEVFIFPTKTGKISPSPTTICLGQRSPILTLSDIDTLEILGWQTSKDKGATWTDIGKAGLTEVNPVRLTVTTWFRAILKAPMCPPYFSTVGIVNVLTPNTPNGTITGTSKVCRPVNTVSLMLTNYTGNIVRWESSSDRWITVNTFNTNAPILTLSNMTATTQFRVITQGPCGQLKSVIYTVLYGDQKIDFTAKIIPGCKAGTIQASTDAPKPTFSIDPPLSPSNTTGRFSQLPLGKYKITVKDSTGCEADTTIEIVSTMPDPPVVLEVRNITTSTAMVIWRKIDGAGVRYHLRYRIVGASSFMTISNLPDTSRFLIGLSENTRYEVQVSAQCPIAPMTDWSTDSVRYFRTEAKDWDCTRPDYPIPSGFFIGDFSMTTASIHWNSIPTTEGYILSYGLLKNNIASWAQIVICKPDTFIVLQNLAPNSFYGVRMRTNCSNCTTAIDVTDLRSDWTGIQTYRTNQRKHESDIYMPLTQSLEASLFPNPNNGTFTLSLIGNKDEIVFYRLIDASGREILKGENIFINEEMNVLFSDQNLASGMYFWNVYCSGTTKVIKMIVE